MIEKTGGKVRKKGAEANCLILRTETEMYHETSCVSQDLASNFQGA